MGRPLFDDGRVADIDSLSRTDYAHNRSNPKKKKKTLTLGVRRRDYYYSHDKHGHT